MHTNFGGCGLSGFGDKISLWSMKVEKFNLSESVQKFMQVGMDSSACTPVLMGVVSPVLEILLPSKMAKFPFWGMDYSPWSSKNLIDRDRLKKIMQVVIDIKCMHTSFGGCGLSAFRDIATFQKRPNFPFRAWSIVHGHRKI